MYRYIIGCALVTTKHIWLGRDCTLHPLGFGSNPLFACFK